MDKFLEMQTFVSVVEAGSFVGAADALAMSKPAVSRHVGELETRLGVRLLHRTTRRLSLTTEGEAFYARCQEVLAAVEAAEGEITSQSEVVSGVIRINAPVTFGVMHLAARWGDFAARHPQVSLEVTLSDRVVDLVDEGYDLAIRIAQLPSSSLVCRKLASTRMVLCASPDYLRREGTPAHPAELSRHKVLAYSYWSMRDEWSFAGPQGNVTVTTHPWLRTNNGDTCRMGALQHQGVILQPSFLVSDDLLSGRLVELLPEYRSISLGIYAMCPTRRLLAPKVRRMIDFLIEAFAQAGWAD